MKFNFAASRKNFPVKLHNLSFRRRCLMLDDGFKTKMFGWSQKKVEGKEKIERYWWYRCELSVQTTTKRDIRDI